VLLPGKLKPWQKKIHKKTGYLRAVQLLSGHTKIDSSVRNLGVELENALAFEEIIEI